MDRQLRCDGSAAAAGYLVGQLSGCVDQCAECWCAGSGQRAAGPPGHPRVVIDPVRDVAIWEWSSKSEVFGNQVPNADADGDGVGFELALRFPGQQATDASGLFYNYQRDYDPAVGRYLQSDPAGLVGGISIYTYVKANPLALTDPEGLRSRDLEYIYKQSGAVPRPPSPYFAEYRTGVMDFIWNCVDIRQSNIKKSVKYFHCKANCEASQRGAGGKAAACNVSNAREIFDQRVKGDSAQDSADDQVANLLGRNHSGDGACSQVCSSLRPNGPPPGC